MKVFQLIIGGGTITATESINLLLATFKGYADENLETMIADVDVWENGFLIESRGFPLVSAETSRVEEFLDDYYEN